MVEIVGWASSTVLLLTIVKQVHKQWSSGTSDGISKWLFIGQLAASLGFMYYSYKKGNWVFLITNAGLTVSNLFGIALYFSFRSRPAEKSVD